MPNAAPVLRTCVRSKKPGITVTLSCSGSLALTRAFVTWSSTTMTAAIDSSQDSSTEGAHQELTASARASWQRSQMPACPGSLDTVGT